MKEWWQSVEVHGGGVWAGVGVGGVGGLLKASTQPTWPDVTGLAKPR